MNDRHLTLKALEIAVKRRCPEIGLLFHSDQGCTYASEDYQVALGPRRITCSMSRRGSCYDNAVMERFFSTVKSETADRFVSFVDGTSTRSSRVVKPSTKPVKLTSLESI